MLGWYWRVLVYARFSGLSGSFDLLCCSVPAAAPPSTTRPGTPAARMRPHVASDVKKERSRQLSALVDGFSSSSIKLVGSKQLVDVVEVAADGHHLVGHTNNYTQVTRGQRERELGQKGLGCPSAWGCKRGRFVRNTFKPLPSTRGQESLQRACLAFWRVRSFFICWFTSSSRVRFTAAVIRRLVCRNQRYAFKVMAHILLFAGYMYHEVHQQLALPADVTHCLGHMTARQHSRSGCILLLLLYVVFGCKRIEVVLFAGVVSSNRGHDMLVQMGCMQAFSSSFLIRAQWMPAIMRI